MKEIIPRYTDMNGKTVYLVMTADDSRKEAMNATLAGIRGFLSCLDDAKEAGIIYGTLIREAALI